LRKWNLQQRILVSFGIILALLVVMAVIAYSRLNAIEEDTRTLQGDSSLGLFTITNMRCAFDENYLVMPRLVFIDVDSESIKRDETRIAETNQAIDQFLQSYKKTLFDDSEWAHFNGQGHYREYGLARRHWHQHGSPCQTRGVGDNRCEHPRAASGRTLGNCIDCLVDCR
jgi:hypothetical protein